MLVCRNGPGKRHIGLWLYEGMLGLVDLIIYCMQQTSTATGRLRKLLHSHQSSANSKKDLEAISSDSRESKSSETSSKLSSKRQVVLE